MVNYKTARQYLEDLKDYFHSKIYSNLEVCNGVVLLEGCIQGAVTGQLILNFYYRDENFSISISGYDYKEADVDREAKEASKPTLVVNGKEVSSYDIVNIDKVIERFIDKEVRKIDKDIESVKAEPVELNLNFKWV